MNSSIHKKNETSEHVDRDMSIFLKLNDGHYKVIVRMANILNSAQEVKTLAPVILSKYRIIRALDHCTTDTLNFVAGILEQDRQDVLVKILLCQAEIQEENM